MRDLMGLFAAFLCVAAAGIASAQDASLPFARTRHDNTLPIELTSDTLSLDQAGSSAEFVGNVRLGQGSLQMSADKVTVKYAASDGVSTGEIELIQAFGNVFLANGSEAAEGDTAVYEVATGQVIMTGNVLLTQGNNALSGDSLRINLETGAAQVEGNVKTIIQPGSQQ